MVTSSLTVQPRPLQGVPTRYKPTTRSELGAKGGRRGECGEGGKRGEESRKGDKAGQRRRGRATEDSRPPSTVG